MRRGKGRLSKFFPLHPRSRLRQLALAASVTFIWSCGDTPTRPTAPPAAASSAILTILGPAPPVTGGVLIGRFDAPPGGPEEAQSHAVPGAPAGLTSQVTGNLVTLAWGAASGDPTTYAIEAGSAPGLVDLANFATGSLATTFSANAPNGRYYGRVLARNAAGTSPPSNEVTIVVGAGPGPCVPPGAPSGLTFTVAGDLATLSWTAPATGSPPISYIVEAGSASGAANLFNGNVGGVTSLTARAAPGVYFVRTRAVNPCGTSGPSNEVSFTVTLQNPLRFTAPAQLNATVGQFFFYSFCKPDLPDDNAALCQSPPATNPSGGQSPYHFQLGSGVGFPPQGLSLRLNGILRGTPSIEGTSTFAVCAVDLAGASVCPVVQMVVTAAGGGIPGTYDGTFTAPALSAVCPSVSGTWSGTITQSGNTLTILWYDSFNQEYYTVRTTLVGNTATWSVNSGDDQIDFTGTFGSGAVSGTFVGPLCTTFAGKYSGTFSGRKR